MPNKSANGSDSFAAALTEVSDRLTRLVQDEIELAKTEVAQKASSLARGAVAVAAGAVFGVFAVIFFLLTLAWVLDGIFVSGAGSLWLGFLIVFVVLLGLTVGSFLFAWKKLKVGAPTPKMAISEGKKIKDTVSAFGADATNGHGPVSADSIASAIAPAIPAAAVATPEPFAAPAPEPFAAPAPIAEPEPEPAAVIPTPPPAEPAPAAYVPPPAPASWVPDEPAPAPIAPEPPVSQSLWTEPVAPEPTVEPPTFVSIDDVPMLTGEAPPAAGAEPQYDVEPVPEDGSDPDSSSTGPEN